MIFDDLTCSGGKIQRVGTATEKHESQHEFNPGNRQQVKTRWSFLGLGPRESMGNRYEGSPEERF